MVLILNFAGQPLSKAVRPALESKGFFVTVWEEPPAEHQGQSGTQHPSWEKFSRGTASAGLFTEKRLGSPPTYPTELKKHLDNANQLWIIGGLKRTYLKKIDLELIQHFFKEQGKGVYVLGAPFNSKQIDGELAELGGEAAGTDDAAKVLKKLFQLGEDDFIFRTESEEEPFSRRFLGAPSSVLVDAADAYKVGLAAQGAEVGLKPFCCPRPGYTDVCPPIVWNVNAMGGKWAIQSFRIDLSSKVSLLAAHFFLLCWYGSSRTTEWETSRVSKLEELFVGSGG